MQHPHEVTHLNAWWQCRLRVDKNSADSVDSISDKPKKKI